MGQCGSARKCLKWELDKCGSLWVHLIKPQIRVRQVWVSVGLLVNCGSLWVTVGQEGVVV